MIQLRVAQTLNPRAPLSPKSQRATLVFVRIREGRRGLKNYRRELLFPLRLNGRYPLVNVYITMENHHAITGKINYFYGHFLCRKLLVITRG